jgi:hypothetical protein
MFYNWDMEANALIRALQRHGHRIGPSGVSHDGFILICVDGKMMKQKEAEILLCKETENNPSVNQACT